MGSAYPGTRRAPRQSEAPRAANDNHRSPRGGYGVMPPMTLTPANDNAARSVGRGLGGVANAAKGMLITDILADAAGVVGSRFTPPGEYVKDSMPVPVGLPPGVSWAQWYVIESQCSVPTAPVWSGIQTTNCSASLDPTPAVPSTQHSSGAVTNYRWRLDRLEFVSPTVRHRFRQRILWRLQVPNGFGGGLPNGWQSLYPDGLPFFGTIPWSYTPIVLGAPWPRALPPPWGRPGPAPLPPEVPWQGNSAGPRPAPRPQFPPDIEILPTPGHRPQAGGSPKVPGPPPKGTKEVKSKLGLNGWPAGVLSLATESVDVIEAIHDALKPECRAKPRFIKGQRRGFGRTQYRQRSKGDGYWIKPTPLEMMEAVYKNFECLDVAQMWSNLLDETLEDMTFGMAGEALRDGPLGTGPLGIQTGPAL